MRKSLFFLFLLTLLLSMTAAHVEVAAAQETATSPGDSEAAPARQWGPEELQRAVELLEAHMTFGADHRIVVTLTPDQAEARGVDEALYHYLLASADATNELLARGDLTPSEVTLSNGLNLLGEAVKPLVVEAPTEGAEACPGHTYGYQRWYGYAV